MKKGLEFEKVKKRCYAPGGMISEEAIQGIGPNPRENTVMKITMLTMGKKPIFCKVWSSTRFRSLSEKKMPSRVPEKAIKNAEAISRIFLPNLSTIRDEMNVAIT